MDIKLVKNLINVFEASSLSELEVADESLQITMKKTASGGVHAPEIKEKLSEIKPLDFNDMREIKSPMVGIFYSSPTPDSPPYVDKGVKVKKGEALCIIEAMKLMNEILAEEDGEIVEVCVADGELVEFGQTLFKMV